MGRSRHLWIVVNNCGMLWTFFDQSGLLWIVIIEFFGTLWVVADQGVKLSILVVK